jgi:hypothetical protein
LGVGVALNWEPAVMVCGRINAFHTSETEQKKKAKKEKESKEETEKRCDAYLGASSDGVWKDEESILPRLLVPGRRRDL